MLEFPLYLHIKMRLLILAPLLFTLMLVSPAFAKGISGKHSSCDTNTHPKPRPCPCTIKNTSSRESDFGFVNDHGNWVIPPRFASASSFNNGLAAVSTNAESPSGGTIFGAAHFFVDKNGRAVYDYGFSRVQPFYANFAKVECTSGGRSCWYRLDKEGFIDGRFENEAGQERLVQSDCSVKLIYRKGLWGLVDLSGKVLVKPTFDGMGIMREGVAPASKNHLFGYINKQGKWIVPPKFGSAAEFSCGLARISLSSTDDNELDFAGSDKKKYGYIDHSGNVVITCKFQDAYSFSEGFAAVKVGPRWGYINTSGDTMLSPKLWGAGSFRNGSAIVDRCESATHGVRIRTEYIGKNFQPITKLPVYRVQNETLVPSFGGSKAGFTTEAGHIIVPLQYDDVRPFREGLAAVKLRSQWGFINKEGTVVVPIRYERVHDFHDGMAAVREVNLFGKHWGYVDASGGTAISPQFDAAQDFGDGVAVVERNRREAPSERLLINKEGALVRSLPSEIRVLGAFEQGLAPAFQGPRAQEDYGIPHTLQCLEYVNTK